jgi:serine-type D-Ala-D-Ala carboxypeptidase (penicillin-binding protein 5/6)
MIFLFLFLSLFQVSPPQNNLIQPSSVFDLSSFAQENFNYLNLPDLSSDVVFIKEINGKILFQKNADKQKDIASITKLMSAYLGYKIFSSKDDFIFDRESLSQEGDVGYFYVGEKISRDEILKASLVASSNDAIYLLAKTYSLEKFVSLMNQKAQEWNMLQTNFVDPTGLGKNFSNARDLFILLTKIYSETPEIFNFTRLEKVNINGKILWTTNLLLPKYSSIIVGAKTGYKETAGENLVMILKFDSSPFIVVILLDSKDRFDDAEKIIKVLKNYYAQ